MTDEEITLPPLTDEQCIDLAREAGLDWHQGFPIGGEEENRYAVMCRAAVLLDRQRRAAPSAEPVAWAETIPWQGGLSNEELRREWDLRLPGVEPTCRELAAFAVGVEAGHKIVWVSDPSFARAREVMQQALDALEAIPPGGADLNQLALTVAGVTLALRAALEGKR